MVDNNKKAIEALIKDQARSNPRCLYGNYIGRFIDTEYLNKKISRVKHHLEALQGTWVDRCRPARWVVLKYFDWRISRILSKCVTNGN